MTPMTDLEKQVYDAIVEDCTYDYSSSVKEVSDRTGLKISTVKGAVGSLVKKGHVAAETEERGGTVFKDLWPMDEWENTLSFGDWN